jgi:hypothetical protein
MKAANKYPTWRRVNPGLIISEEQRDGTPDFYVHRDGHRDRPGKWWWVKWRTSAHWTGPFETAALAMASVEKQFES